MKRLERQDSLESANLPGASLDVRNIPFVHRECNLLGYRGFSKDNRIVIPEGQPDTHTPLAVKAAQAEQLPLVPLSPDTSREPSYEALTPVSGMPRYPVLDGWRGVSILLVMAGHLLPLGPKRLTLNGIAATLGMAIFFTLSGFLITTTLFYRPNVTEFLIRRFCRILPLAWLFTVVALTLAGASFSVFRAQLLFYSNLPPFWITDFTPHLWSLCVEMQFYVAIALICLLFGRRGLWSIPFFCLLVTAYRIETHTLISIVTIIRVDEILAGGTLALVCNDRHLGGVRKFLTWISPLAIMPFAIASASQYGGPFNYLRPYLVAGMVGSTLLYHRTPSVTRYLHAKSLAYLAEISYALYIFHPMVQWGWLGRGSAVIKYAKRAPAFVVVFGLAHLSSFYYEKFWIRKGKEWSKYRFSQS